MPTAERPPATDGGRGAEELAVRRRRRIDPVTCDVEYTDEALAFLKAMERYRRVCQRPFPTLREVLEVLHSLGYRKVAEPGPLPGCGPTDR